VILLIDIHCHILPQADDGPDTLEKSLAMAKKAVRDGIKTIVATPHHLNGRYTNNKFNIEKDVRELQTNLDKHGIDLNVLPGQELHCSSSLSSYIYNDSGILTLNNSRYLLLELPSGEIPLGFWEIIHEIRVMNLTPIIAHPERNKEILGKVDILSSFVEEGVLIQVTAQSLLGGFGPTIQKAARRMCQQNTIHFIASDAHNNSTRPFLMKEACNWVLNEMGNDYVEYYLDNAERVIRNQEVVPMTPQLKKKNRLFFWMK